jgi:hypothetical protein
MNKYKKREPSVRSCSLKLETLSHFIFLEIQNTLSVPATRNAESSVAFCPYGARKPLSISVPERAQSSVVSVPGNVEASMISNSCGARNLLWVSVPRSSKLAVRSSSWETKILCGFPFLRTRNLGWVPVIRNPETHSD